MELKETIMTLAKSYGPAGFEGPAIRTAENLLRPYVDETYTDTMGNLIGWRRCGKENAPVVMVDAHMDEIGLIVTGYDKGFLRFQTLGGVDPRMLPALEVLVLAEKPLYGVIDALPPHVLSAEEREKPVPMDKLFIDVGLSEEEAKKAVPLGTPVVFNVPCTELGGHQICGKSLDDRSCAAILIHVLEKTMGKKFPFDLAVLLSVQEEVGLRGAMPGAYAVNPEAAIIVDVTHGKTPDASKAKTLAMNGGAAIGVGPNMARSVSDKLEELAAAHKIPYQLEVMSGRTGTNAWNIQVSREGVATGVLSLPLKYMHTPVEVIDLRDAESIVELISLWLENYGEEK